MRKMGLAGVTAIGALLAACADTGGGEPTGVEGEALHRGAIATVVAFDASKGQLPEGLALHDGDAYVSFAPLASVARVDKHGTVSPYAELPSTAGGTKGYTLGLAFDKDDALYVAQASFDPSVVPGIYRVSPGGGKVTEPWARHPSMTFPNGLAFDHAGALYVTDSAQGAVFRADRDGNVTEWKRDPALAYDASACANAPPFPVGANGIVVTPKEVWVTNTSTGALIRIPFADGSKSGAAGAIDPLVTDCRLAGADGLARTKDGSLFVALNARNEVVRVDAKGGITSAFQGSPLAFPATVASDGNDLWITNAAFLGGSPALEILRAR